jgi:hypothetical protein
MLAASASVGRVAMWNIVQENIVESTLKTDAKGPRDGAS